MKADFDDLRQFAAFLEKKGDLVRVRQQVDPVLELNAILDRLARIQGPAVLFENVAGSQIPFLGNLYGAKRRLGQAFGVNDYDALVEGISSDLHAVIGRSNQEVLLALKSQGLAEKFKNFKKAMKSAPWSRSIAQAKKGLAMLPVQVSRSKSPCKEVVISGPGVDLTRFPFIKCWPKDGGKFATYPLVITRDPENGALNVGIYRMMLLDKNRMCMHWLPQKHGNQHHAKYEKHNREMPVCVVVGADPALEVAGVFQLLPPLDEFMAAGMLKGSPIRYTLAEDSDLWVPSGAQIVFEGIIKPHERVDEGPFGEFNGFYSAVKQTPVFHVKKITMRAKPLWHGATTGMPPTEIHVLSKAMERIGVVVARLFFPGVKNLNLMVESGTLYIMVAALEKTRPYEAADLMYFLWSAATQSPYITNLIVVDSDIDIFDTGQVFEAIARNVRPLEDVTITARGLADMEKPSTQPRGVGSRMGVDATRKWPQEGADRQAQERRFADPVKTAAQMEDAMQKFGPDIKKAVVRADPQGWISVIAALAKKKPWQARQVIEHAWEIAPRQAKTVNVFVVDDTIDPADLSQVFWAISMHMRPEHDALLNDPEKTGRPVQGMGLDATSKTPEEGLVRGMSPLVSMSREILEKVEKNWRNYGFE